MSWGERFEDTRSIKRAVKHPEDIFPDTKVVFKGECHAVVLCWRSSKDPHICVNFATEDDESWFPYANGFSSAWMPAFLELVLKAQSWMEINAEPHMSNGKQYGWKFKND